MFTVVNRRTARHRRRTAPATSPSGPGDLVASLPALPPDLTREEAVARMRDLYARLPPLDCRGLCHSTCTVIAATELEYQLVEDTGVSIRPRLALITNETVPDCPALGPLRNCTVYALRPLLCRAYGVVEGLRCVHGCVPAQLLSNREYTLIRRQLEQLSRHVTSVHT